LNAIDVFVLPSISECLSNTLLEAMSAGLPVVATRVGGNPELVEDQSSGLLFSVGNIRELAGHLEKLVANREYRESLGTAARARILANYSLDSMLNRYRNLYKELAARRGVSALQAA
jgi:glycosyltransferase involved in cell wall biosynthesis